MRMKTVYIQPETQQISPRVESLMLTFSAGKGGNDDEVLAKPADDEDTTLPEYSPWSDENKKDSIK